MLLLHSNIIIVTEICQLHEVLFAVIIKKNKGYNKRTQTGLKKKIVTVLGCYHSTYHCHVIRNPYSKRATAPRHELPKFLYHSAQYWCKFLF